jgi:hypothetical protein
MSVGVAGPLVVTYPLSERSRAIVAEELGGAAAPVYLADLAPPERAAALRGGGRRSRSGAAPTDRSGRHLNSRSDHCFPDLRRAGAKVGCGAGEPFLARPLSWPRSVDPGRYLPNGDSSHW